MERQATRRLHENFYVVTMKGNVSHTGSLYTATDYRLSDGSMVRLNVTLEKLHTVSNFHTYYKIYVYTKGRRCSKWIYQFTSERTLDERITAMITNQQLYEALNNHWVKLNPIRIFSTLQYDNELKNFSVEEVKQTKHLVY